MSKTVKIFPKSPYYSTTTCRSNRDVKPTQNRYSHPKVDRPAPNMGVSQILGAPMFGGSYAG